MAREPALPCVRSDVWTPHDGLRELAGCSPPCAPGSHFLKAESALPENQVPPVSHQTVATAGAQEAFAE